MVSYVAHVPHSTKFCKNRLSIFS